MPFIRAGDITVHYLLEGPDSAPVAMFSNSLCTTLSLWDGEAARLRSKYRVLRYDTRGHGLTDAPAAGEKGYTIDQLADDAAALIAALGFKRVHLCGLSIGGMLGQRLAAKAPSLLASLMLCDTAATMHVQTWDERIAAVRKGGLEVIADGTLQRWFTAPFRERHPDTIRGIRNMVARTPLEGYLGCAAAIRDMDLRADDKKISCPTLVLVGSDDPATTVADARGLHAAIAGSTLAILEPAAHITPLEQPLAFHRAIAGFLDAQPWY